MDTKVVHCHNDKENIVEDRVSINICSKQCLCGHRTVIGRRSLSSSLRHSLNSCRWNYIAFVFLCLNYHTPVLSETVAPTTTTSNNDSAIQGSLSTYVEDDNADIPKAVVTLAGLLFFFVAAFALAKLIDYCHDRRAIRDDASDISDYTKELLKGQMMMLAFSKGRSKGKKLKPKEAALKFGKMWRAKVARNKARLMKVHRVAMTEALAKGKDPQAEAAKAVAAYEDKRIRTQMNGNKASGKPGKNEAELDETKVAMVNGKAAKPANSEKPPLPSIKSTESGTFKEVPAKLFTVSETHSALKPSENSSSKTNKPVARTSSRPISAGLKSRPGSAKSLKSRKIFANMLKK